MKIILIFCGLYFILSQDTIRKAPNDVMPLNDSKARIEMKQTNDTEKANKAEKYIPYETPKTRDI